MRSFATCFFTDHVYNASARWSFKALPLRIMPEGSGASRKSAPVRRNRPINSCLCMSRQTVLLYAIQADVQSPCQLVGAEKSRYVPEDLWSELHSDRAGLYVLRRDSAISESVPAPESSLDQYLVPSTLPGRGRAMSAYRVGRVACAIVVSPRARLGVSLLVIFGQVAHVLGTGTTAGHLLGVHLP